MGAPHISLEGRGVRGVTAEGQRGFHPLCAWVVGKYPADCHTPWCEALSWQAKSSRPADCHTPWCEALSWQAKSSRPSRGRGFVDHDRILRFMVFFYAHA